MKMPDNLLSFLEAYVPTPILIVFAVYFIIGTSLVTFGWLPLYGTGRKLREISPIYDTFVRDYLLGRGYFLRLQSWFLIPGIAVGVINRSLWGRSFRNLEPEEAERLAQTCRLNIAEKIYSHLMLLNMSVIAICLVISAVYMGVAWCLRQLGGF